MASNKLKTIGLMCNYEPGKDPRETNTLNQLVRAIGISRVLNDFGTKLFIFSPRYVNLYSGEAPGFYIEDNEFQTVDQCIIPTINADFIGRGRFGVNGMKDHKEFINWTKQTGRYTYVPSEIIDISNSKSNAYNLIAEFDRDFQPFTELFDNSRLQLEKFLDINDTVFIKPSGGSGGSGIIRLKKENSKYVLDDYSDKQKKNYLLNNLEQVLDTIGDLDSEHIIQVGINTSRCDGACFDIRVIMVNDGDRFNFISQARVGAKNYDISNTSMGGKDMILEEVLSKVYGDESDDLINKIKRKSFELIEFLDNRYPGQIMEIAFDIMIDENLNLKLAETNGRPGILFYVPKGLFSGTPEEMIIYNQYVLPHVTYMANFLQTKLELLD